MSTGPAYVSPHAKPFPRGPFGTILADPAWSFSNKATRATADNHYPTMPAWMIAALPVSEITADSAHLFMWCPSALLAEGLGVLQAWGFTLKGTSIWVKTKALETVLVVDPDGAVPPRVEHRLTEDAQERVHNDWEHAQPSALKLQIGLGNYLRQTHEVVLFGVRGSAAARAHNLPSTFFAPRGRHSSKPTILHKFAELMSPGPQIELFARQPMPGWTVWGNEVLTPERAAAKAADEAQMAAEQELARAAFDAALDIED